MDKTEIITQPLGAISSIPSQHFTWGDVTRWTFRTDNLNAATTTPLAIQAPAATSTLALGSGCRFEVSSSSAKAIRFAKATSPNATTTFLFGANIAAGAKGTVVASTSIDAFVFEPNSWLTMSMVGGSGVDSPSGSCHATFVQI